MNKVRKVIYLPIAVEDLDEIFDYISQDDPNSAVDIIDEFDKRVSGLAYYPEMGPVPKDERLAFLGYRVLVVREYLIFYVVKEEAVEIRRMIHGKRRYSFLL